MKPLLAMILVALTFTHGLASAQTPTPALNLVVIGDSIPFGGFCPGCEQAFVDDYALRLEDMLLQEVNVTNRSRDDGAQLNQITEQVETDATLREQLTSADLVIISAGYNDGPPWTSVHPCGSDLGPAARDIIDQMLSYTEDCLDEAVTAREGDFRRLFQAVDALVPDASPVLVLNTYNWWTGSPTLAAEATTAELEHIDRTIAHFLDGWNEQLCALAVEHGFVCIDLYHAFNGPNGMSPAGELLDFENIHPSKVGNALIADLLMEADVFGDGSATPSPVEASPTS